MSFDGLHRVRVAIYLGLLVVVGTLGWWASWFGRPELTIRSAGFILQVIGFLIVFIDVTAAARKHKVASIFSVIRAKLRRRNVVAAVGSASGSISLTGHGVGVVVTPTTPTLEERVQMIERQQEAIKQDINTLRQETRETTNEISSRLESRAGELGARVQQVRDDIREAAASLIHIEVVGVWLFGVGSFLSTFSKEISECSFLIG
jgi:hypothetical protein